MDWTYYHKDILSTFKGLTGNMHWKVHGVRWNSNKSVLVMCVLKLRAWNWDLLLKIIITLRGRNCLRTIIPCQCQLLFSCNRTWISLFGGKTNRNSHRKYAFFYTTAGTTAQPHLIAGLTVQVTDGRSQSLASCKRGKSYRSCNSYL